MLGIMDQHWIDNVEQIIDMTPQDWLALNLPMGLLNELQQYELLYGQSRASSASLEPRPAGVGTVEAQGCPFTRDFYMAMPGLSPTALLTQFVMQREHASVRKRQQVLSWAFETGAAEGGIFVFRAHCTLALVGRSRTYTGGWRVGKRAAEADCAAAILELHQVDAALYGGKAVRRVLRPQSEAGLLEATAPADVHARLARRFKPQLMPSQRLVQWEFEQSDNNACLFRAVARVEALGPELFQSDFVVGKKRAQRSACLKIQERLDQLERQEREGEQPNDDCGDGAA